MSSRRLVMVEWADAFGCSSHWSELPEAAEPEAEPLIAKSVGWLVRDGEKTLLLVPHLVNGSILDGREQGCGDMSIPRQAVLRIVDLVEVAS